MVVFLISFLVVSFIFLLVHIFSIRRIIRLFKDGNVLVTGLRGRGKDMLMSNVIARRKTPYVSNMDYKCKRSVFIPLDFSKIDPQNNYKDFISGQLNNYNYPLPENVDIYLSDGGVYFPSQYCNELNKAYPRMPVFQALSRHLGNCNFHVNVQNVNRLWDKIREQCDTYIICNSCFVLGRLVFQTLTIYDKYQSCCDRVEPYKHIKVPFTLSSVARAEYKSRDEQLYRQFRQDYGSVVRRLVIYRNKSKYDTRLFKKLLSKGGVADE